jgi:hypothetical protein
MNNKMKSAFRLCGLVALFAVILAGCENPTTDPPQHLDCKF